MIFKKNKYRTHTCGWCKHSDLNIYYGCKSYDDIPILNDYSILKRDKCILCGKNYYYIERKE